jgi:hypothetical protein
VNSRRSEQLGKSPGARLVDEEVGGRHLENGYAVDGDGLVVLVIFHSVATDGALA